MLLALEKVVHPDEGRPAERDCAASAARLNITVVFTSDKTTASALQKAASLAGNLGARVALVVPQVVPYPLPLEDPPVHLSWNEHRCTGLADACEVETVVRIYLCRDRLEVLSSVLCPGSIVVVGCRKAWLPTSETRLARELRRLGHDVILTEAE